VLLVEEGLFLVAFAGWAFVRAANPEIVGTEKPMELAFINSILHSSNLPPHDPWLSGFAISYYYFGYVLVSMLARLAGTLPGVAFNMGISLIFALSALGAYGVVYNLLAFRKESNPQGSDDTPTPLAAPLLGPFFILIVSNLEGFFRLLHHGGVFWRRQNGQLVSGFWEWIGLKELTQPPQVPFTWSLDGHWWWWQASRVVQDFDFNWVNKGDVIDEFPFFSFLLADLHPHVLMMPFAFLAMALSLNLFLRGGESNFRILGLNLKLDRWDFWLGAVVLGGLAFLNTWDFPIYVALFAGAYALAAHKRGLREESSSTSQATSPAIQIIKDFLILGFTLGVTGIILYLPFYIGFSSQAGGLLPNLIYITRGVYLWVMFAPLLVPLFTLLIYFWKTKKERVSLKRGLKVVLGVVLGLGLLAHILALIIAGLPMLSGLNPDASLAPDAYLGSVGAPNWGALVREGLVRRLTVPGTLLTLIILIGMLIALLWPEREETTLNKEDASSPYAPRASDQHFVMMLILLGGLLVLVPEFVFLRDLFGYRINTIFKFYFQTWLFWGVASAYAVVVLWDELSAALGAILLRVGILIPIVLSLVYPLSSLWDKTQGFSPAQGWTLDGTAYRMRNSPAEAAAAAWLRDAPRGVVVEAVGGSYSSAARMAAHSGQPTILGWEFHEMQWRGGLEEIGSRQSDVARLYCTRDWNAASAILDQYDVRYVVVGGLERATYTGEAANCVGGLAEGKFERFLETAFQEGDVTIYQIPQSSP
jgi:YYY domain-containing protein